MTSRALIGAEVRRLARNRRVLVVASVLPLLLFLSFSSSGTHERFGGIDSAAYVMVSMATFSALQALVVGSTSIANERAIGWPRQLRVAGVRGHQYLIAKFVALYAVAAAGLCAVLAAGAIIRHVDLSAARLGVLAVTILVCLLPMAAVALIIGLTARPNRLQLVGVAAVVAALLGGMLNATENFPTVVQHVMKALPMYWAAAAGRDVVVGTWVGWYGAFVLAGWTTVLGTLAVVAYRRDGRRPNVAGAT